MHCVISLVPYILCRLKIYQKWKSCPNNIESAFPETSKLLLLENRHQNHKLLLKSIKSQLFCTLLQKNFGKNLISRKNFPLYPGFSKLFPKNFPLKPGYLLNSKSRHKKFSTISRFSTISSVTISRFDCISQLLIIFVVL